MIQIYIITNLINRKKYVGQTKASLQRRWKRHVRDAINGKKYAMSRAIRKYGELNFKIKCVDLVKTNAQADIKERKLIKRFDTIRRGYNLTEGGCGVSGYVPSKEARKKMSESHIGKPGYWAGREFTEEHKKNLSRSKIGNTNSVGKFIGKDNPMFGRKRPDLAAFNKKRAKCLKISI